jgi:hypothetical protein
VEDAEAAAHHEIGVTVEESGELGIAGRFVVDW